MTTQYTPTEKLHTCQACTLADAMKICHACQFQQPIQPAYVYKQHLIKCEALETAKGIKLGDFVTHLGIPGKMQPDSGHVTKIEYWLDYDLSYYRLTIKTARHAMIEASEAFYLQQVTNRTPNP